MSFALLPLVLIAGQIGTEEPTLDGPISMVYHGGPVMLGTPTAYVIWYGDFGPGEPKDIIEHELRNLGGTLLLGIDRTYPDGQGRAPNGTLAFGGAIQDNYSLGRMVHDTDVPTIVANAIHGGRLPLDGNGVDVKFVFTHSAAFCGACIPQNLSVRSPNGSRSMDAVADTVFHEVAETISDPDLNAWTDTIGRENADICQNNFGAGFPSAIGAPANVRLGGRDYFLQTNLVNDGSGRCVQGWPTEPQMPPTPTNCTIEQSCNYSVGVTCDALEYVFELQRNDAGASFVHTILSDSHLPRNGERVRMTDNPGAGTYFYMACTVDANGRSCGNLMQAVAPICDPGGSLPGDHVTCPRGYYSCGGVCKRSGTGCSLPW